MPKTRKRPRTATTSTTDDSVKRTKKQTATNVDTKNVPKRHEEDELIFVDYPEFRPNKSPKEILQSGCFGGTYFRPIKSGVTNEKYSGCWKEFPDDWFEGLKIASHVASQTYDKEVNKYRVKCGGSLDMWESSGWIKAQDPYGWFQWYCRFYLGRRTPDDERQVGRWKRFLARFKTNLLNKIIKANTRYDDFTISPVIRQALLHWGYEVNQEDVTEQLKKTKTNK